MQQIFSKPLAALLGAFMAVCFLLPTEAKADPTYDCASGCWIVTCEGANCTLYRCDSTGCTAVSTFQRPYTQEKSAAESSKGPWDENAFVKVCPVNRACSLFELSRGESKFLGSFDNIDSIVRELSEEKKRK